MSDTPRKRGPKPKGLYPYTAMLTKDQIDLVHAAGPRQGNQLIRDAIDFIAANKPLFLAWLATRG